MPHTPENLSTRPTSPPHFDDQGRLVAPAFDDFYFSKHGGLAETQHVFLQGNTLPARFASLPPRSTFTLGETGFGTGLNFLTTWQAFEEHAPADATLQFISVEKHLLDAPLIKRALDAWPELAPHAKALTDQIHPMLEGFHRLSFASGRIQLTLLLGEAQTVLANLHTQVDAWFLDGFTPARNQAMWSPEVFKQIARLSTDNTTLSTYTAAGFVRRGLKEVGFDIQKQPGFGPKRDMTAGRFISTTSTNETANLKSAPWFAPPPAHRPQQRRALVLGAGLAGAAVAAAIAHRGWSVDVVDRQRLINGSVAGLSPRVAVVQPRLGDLNDPGGRYLRTAHAYTMRWLAQKPDAATQLGWQRCGSLHLQTNPAEPQRLNRFADDAGDAMEAHQLHRDEASELAGIDVPCPALLIKNAGLLKPAKFCAALLSHPSITLHESFDVTALTRSQDHWQLTSADNQNLEADVIIIANATDALALPLLSDLPLIPVRGQVIQPQAIPTTQSLRCIINAMNYLTPAVEGRHTLGATYTKNDRDTAMRTADTATLIAGLSNALPEIARTFSQQPDLPGWAATRCTTPDHLPLIGALPDAPAYRRDYAKLSVGDPYANYPAPTYLPGLYVSLGHNSHGVSSSLFAAQLIADQIQGHAPALEADLQNATHPARFLIRRIKRN